MGTAQGSEPLDAIALDLIRSASRLTRISNRLPGITYSSIAWRVLSDLERTGPERVSVLAEQQRVAQPTMTTLVHRLEGESWVVREPDPADGRASLVAITEPGRRALTNYRESIAALITPHISELAEADQAALARAAVLMQLLADSV